MNLQTCFETIFSDSKVHACFSSLYRVEIFVPGNPIQVRKQLYGGLYLFWPCETPSSPSEKGERDIYTWSLTWLFLIRDHSSFRVWKLHSGWEGAAQNGSGKCGRFILINKSRQLSVVKVGREYNSWKGLEVIILEMNISKTKTNTRNTRFNSYINVGKIKVNIYV